MNRLIYAGIVCLCAVACHKYTPFETGLPDSFTLNDITISAPASFWGDTQTIKILHRQDRNAEIPFEIKGTESAPLLVFKVPLPDKDDMKYYEEGVKIYYIGTTTIIFKSERQDFRAECTFYKLGTPDKTKQVYGDSDMNLISVDIDGRRYYRDDGHDRRWDSMFYVDM